MGGVHGKKKRKLLGWRFCHLWVSKIKMCEFEYNINGFIYIDRVEITIIPLPLDLTVFDVIKYYNIIIYKITIKK